MGIDAASITAAGLTLLEAMLDEERPGWAQDMGLVSRAQSLSLGFTEEQRSLTPAAKDDVPYAYLAYFAPRTLAAVSASLGGGPVPERIIDLGAGTGALSLAFALAGTAHLTLIDHDPHALEVARRLLARVPGKIQIETHCTTVETATPWHHETTVASAFTLGELATHDDGGAHWQLLLRTAPSANRFFLVDAGDYRRARRLQELRKAALEAGWHVAAPCPHEEPCPALERARDWCHLRAPRRLTERLGLFAAATGRDPQEMAFSHLDLWRHLDQPAQDGLLVLGEPRKEKGRVRLPVCGAGGLRYVQALKRDRRAHDGLLSLERGTRLSALEFREFERRGDTAHLQHWPRHDDEQSAPPGECP
ncbi:MAG: small ribosomal subunit Rsm22 family protein [Myxococcota bacterium]